MKTACERFEALVNIKHLLDLAYCEMDWYAGSEGCLAEELEALERVLEAVRIKAHTERKAIERAKGGGRPNA